MRCYYVQIIQERPTLSLNQLKRFLKILLKGRLKQKKREKKERFNGFNNPHQTEINVQLASITVRRGIICQIGSNSYKIVTESRILDGRRKRSKSYHLTNPLQQKSIIVEVTSTFRMKKMKNLSKYSSCQLNYQVMSDRQQPSRSRSSNVAHL